MSDFKTKFLQRVRFQIKFFTTRQILKQNFHNVSDFESKILQRVRFCFKKLFKNQILRKNVHTKNSRFDLIYPVKWTNFAIFCVSKKHDSDAESVFKKQVS